MQNHLRAFNSNENSKKLDPRIVEGLIKMFDMTNEFVKLFRQARDKFDIEGLIL